MFESHVKTKKNKKNNVKVSVAYHGKLEAQQLLNEYFHKRVQGLC